MIIYICKLSYLITDMYYHIDIGDFDVVDPESEANEDK
jgi:hypothetical protein